MITDAEIQRLHYTSSHFAAFCLEYFQHHSTQERIPMNRKSKTLLARLVRNHLHGNLSLYCCILKTVQAKDAVNLLVKENVHNVP